MMFLFFCCFQISDTLDEQARLSKVQGPKVEALKAGMIQDTGVTKECFLEAL